MRNATFFCLLIAGALCLSAGPALADVLLLEDGRILDGRKMERTGEGVKVHFENGDVLVPSRLIRDVVIENDTSFVPKTPEEKEKWEKGLVPYKGRWVSKDRRDREVQEEIEARREQVVAVRKLAKWRNRGKEDTKHFRFEYSVAPHIFDNYRDMMEAYFTNFAKTWRVRQPRGDERLLVCFYTDRKAFSRTSGAGGGALGYYKFVDPKELNFFYDRLDPRLSTEVMFHEANHYLQDLIDESFSMPHFPGEAIAEYYGASTWDPEEEELTVGLIQEGRLTNVKTDVAAGQMWSLEKLVSTSRTYNHYDWGWTLVHFLMNDRSYEKKFTKWVVALAKARDIERVPQGNPGLVTVEGKEVWRSFRKYLGLRDEDDVKELEEEWHEYVKEELEVTSARGLEKAAFDAVRTGRPIRAKRLFKEAIEAGSTSAKCHARYADLVGGDEAVPMLKKAIELDPLVGDYYADLGSKLLSSGNEEEGKRYLRLALEVDPEDFWLEDRVKDLLKE